MNCELIFYLSTKTSRCEKALRSSIESLDLKLGPAMFSTAPQKLGALIIEAFERCDLVFVISGFTKDSGGIENVLSKALANKRPDFLKKLRNPLSNSDGYLIRQGGQLLIVLPDEPAEIEAVFSQTLKNYILSVNNF